MHTSVGNSALLHAHKPLLDQLLWIVNSWVSNVARVPIGSDASCWQQVLQKGMGVLASLRTLQVLYSWPVNCAQPRHWENQPWDALERGGGRVAAAGAAPWGAAAAAAGAGKRGAALGAVGSGMQTDTLRGREKERRKAKLEVVVSWQEVVVGSCEEVELSP